MVDAIEIGYHVMVMGDLNRWVGNKLRLGVTEAFDVDRENE